MANVYVYSGAVGAGTGADWANAYTTLAAAYTAKAAGDYFWVAHDHAETQATAMTMTCPGTTANPCFTICVSRLGSVPPVAADLATTATITTTGTSAMALTGSGYWYGITFSQGTTDTNNGFNICDVAGPHIVVFEACKLKMAHTGGAARIAFGRSNNATPQEITLINTTVDIGSSTGNGLVVRCHFRWFDTVSAYAGATIPTILFIANTGANGSANVLCRGVDFSALGSGKSLVGVGNGIHNVYHFENCKLGALVSLTSGTIAGGGDNVWLVNCDSGDTNYRYQYTDYRGTITHDTAIVRINGATDGTTNISRKMVTSANSKFHSPLVSDPIIVLNKTINTALTGTIEIITDNVTLTDADVWVEIEYLGTSGFPLALFAKDRASNILSTPVNHTTSSEIWVTTGLVTPVKQNLSISFTPLKSGPIAFRVYLAKSSTTMYFDLKLNGFNLGAQYQFSNIFISEPAKAINIIKAGGLL